MIMLFAHPVYPYRNIYVCHTNVNACSYKHHDTFFFERDTHRAVTFVYCFENMWAFTIIIYTAYAVPVGMLVLIHLK